MTISEKAKELECQKIGQTGREKQQKHNENNTAVSLQGQQVFTKIKTLQVSEHQKIPLLLICIILLHGFHNLGDLFRGF